MNNSNACHDILLHVSRIPPQQENIEAVSYHCPYLLQKYSEMVEMRKNVQFRFQMLFIVNIIC